MLVFLANGVLAPLTGGLFRLVFRSLRITGAPDHEVVLSCIVLLIYVVVLFSVIYGLLSGLQMLVVSVTFFNFSLLIVTVIIFLVEWSATSSTLMAVGPIVIQKVVWTHYELWPILNGYLDLYGLSDLSETEKLRLMKGYPVPEEMLVRVQAKRVEVDDALAAASAAAIDTAASWSGWLTEVMNSPVTQGVLIVASILWPVVVSYSLMCCVSYANSQYLDYAVSNSRVMTKTVGALNNLVVQHNSFVRLAEQHNHLYQVTGTKLLEQIAAHAGQIVAMAADIDDLSTQIKELSNNQSSAN